MLERVRLVVRNLSNRRRKAKSVKLVANQKHTGDGWQHRSKEMKSWGKPFQEYVENTPEFEMRYAGGIRHRSKIPKDIEYNLLERAKWRKNMEKEQSRHDQMAAIDFFQRAGL